MKRTSGILFGALIALTAACGDATSSDVAAARPTSKVSVAAASDLQFTLPELIAAFRVTRPDVAVDPTFGSSGAFATQIQRDAPFDVFLSADASYVDDVVKAGVAREETRFVYATGRLALWVRSASKLDVAKGLEVLRDAAVLKIAIANPAHAPYGRAAEEALKRANVYDAVKERLVLGDNISQTAQFVQSGAADAGLIALSLASAPAMSSAGRTFVVPADLHAPLKQTGVVLRRATDAAAADAWCAFLKSPEGRRILAVRGFGPTEN